MFAMSPEQVHRQVVRSQELVRRQVAAERQAAKAPAVDTATPAETRGRDTLRTIVATTRRALDAVRPHSARPAPAR